MMVKTDVNSIGVLLTTFMDEYQDRILEGIQDEAHRQNARILCFCGRELTDSDIISFNQSKFFNLIAPDNIDALIVLAGPLCKYSGTDKLSKFLSNYPEIPVVCIGIEVPGFVSITVDNELSVRELISHMVETHGCRRIAFIKGTEENDEAVQRFNAYKSSLKEYNLAFEPSLIAPGELDFDSGLIGVRYLIDEQKEVFDALICVDDQTAIKAVQELKNRGFKIPEDIKVTGFDDIEISKSILPPLTTVQQPLFKLGSMGVKSAVDLLNRKLVPKVQKLKTNLIIRDSCGCQKNKNIKRFNMESHKTVYPHSKKRKISRLIVSRIKELIDYEFPTVALYDFNAKLQYLVDAMIESLLSNKPGNEITEAVKNTVSAFFDTGLAVSEWNKIFTLIFNELSRINLSGQAEDKLNLLWIEALVALYEVESYLQSHKKINYELESDMLQWIGDQLAGAFSIKEINRKLIRFLPNFNIFECYISLFTEEEKTTRQIFNFNKTETGNEQWESFTGSELVPGGFEKTPSKSYCILQLNTKLEQLGFVIFKFSFSNLKKYYIIAAKLTIAIKGALLIEEIKKQNLALLSSEEDLRITLDSICDAVIATDKNGIITRMNPVAEKLTGWLIEEARGGLLDDIFQIFNNDFHEKLECPSNRIIKTGKVSVSGYNIVLVSRDKSKHLINYSGSPIYNPEGKIVGVVLVFRDITEQYKIEEKLRHSQKMDSLGKLSGGVAHDFNNMLAGISGYAQLIKNDYSKLKELVQYADIILNTIDNATELTQKLLAFSRKAKMQSVSLDVHMCITDAIHILKHSIDKRIILKKELNAEVSTIMGDPSQIQNLILNLCLNARDAMPHGGELVLSTSDIYLNEKYCNNSAFDLKPGTFIEISVMDNGTGMSKEMQNKIFDPFFTTKDVGKGTGLGLSAVYGIVCDHNGAIQLFSEPGRGTVFKIYLPVYKTLVEPAEYNESETKTGTGTILIIDDEVLIQDFLKKMLPRLGYKVMTAKDGIEGVKIFENMKNEIDIILLDIVMPKMSGSEVFYKIKGIRPDVKILLISGFSRDLNINELIANGALGFLQKPFRLAELSKIIVNALNH